MLGDLAQGPRLCHVGSSRRGGVYTCKQGRATCQHDVVTLKHTRGGIRSAEPEDGNSILNTAARSIRDLDLMSYLGVRALIFYYDGVVCLVRRILTDAACLQLGQGRKNRLPVNPLNLANCR